MASHQNYQVLARTTRPTKFSELIGQEALAQTLKNAIESGRLAHAFILTGTRGVGKTTTARLMARALNCVGADGQGLPTSEPCGTCAPCQAIADDRHVDVIEVDAATRTGVDDMRQLMEGMSYKPVMGRYKIYIIDEVHMLSKNAFNALLKTLEEPPPHVKFIFATTEIKKVPLTILSRCQRFDLKRISTDVLVTHFTAILEKEGVKFEPEALACIARAAGGSVRDGLSILEQTIVRCQEEILTLSLVQQILGLTDKTKIMELFVLLLKGQVRACLEAAQALYMNGADPELILQELLEMVYQTLVLKTAGVSTTNDPSLKKIADIVEAPSLMLMWQVLIKGGDEIRLSSLPLETLEVILIRAMHIQGVLEASPPERQAAPSVSSKPSSAPEPVAIAPQQPPAWTPKTFEDVVHLFEKKREPIIADYLLNNVGVVHCEPGLLKLHLVRPAAENFQSKISKLLTEYTHAPWMVEYVTEKGEEPLSIQRLQAKEEREKKLLETPDAKKITELFPGAQVIVK